MSALDTLSVVFDLDGTLVDSEPNYYEAGRRTLVEYGVPDFSWKEHERYVGISTRETIADWRRRYRLSASVDELVAVKNHHYLELARTKTTVFPEMRAFVERLADEGVPMAVASGSSASGVSVSWSSVSGRSESEPSESDSSESAEASGSSARCPRPPSGRSTG